MTDPPTPPPDPYRDLDTLHPGSRLTGDEVEFALAMREYQLRRRRRYPAWCEVLYVLRRLGYAKTGRADEELTTETQRHREDEERVKIEDR